MPRGTLGERVSGALLVSRLDVRQSQEVHEFQRRSQLQKREQVEGVGASALRVRGFVPRRRVSSLQVRPAASLRRSSRCGKSSGKTWTSRRWCLHWRGMRVSLPAQRPEALAHEQIEPAREAGGKEREGVHRSAAGLGAVPPTQDLPRLAWRATVVIARPAPLPRTSWPLRRRRPSRWRRWRRSRGC